MTYKKLKIREMSLASYSHTIPWGHTGKPDAGTSGLRAAEIVLFRDYMWIRDEKCYQYVNKMYVFRYVTK